MCRVSTSAVCRDRRGIVCAHVSVQCSSCMSSRDPVVGELWQSTRCSKCMWLQNVERPTALFQLATTSCAVLASARAYLAAYLEETGLLLFQKYVGRAWIRSVLRGTLFKCCLHFALVLWEGCIYIILVC
eukprot:6423551-Amphidinium_carterae.1